MSTPETVEADSRGPGEHVRLSRLQRTIAANMEASRAAVPVFTSSVTVDVGQVRELRRESGASWSINDAFLRASALALRSHEILNAAVVDDRTLRVNASVNLGVAVAVERGLIVPVVRDVDKKGLDEIHSETVRLAQLAREREITSEDLDGATFTVSNLGMLGIERFEAIVSTPQVGILAVGSIGQRLVMTPEGPAERHELAVTLSADHRVVYGADAAEFLGELKRHVEEPSSELLGVG